MDGIVDRGLDDSVPVIYWTDNKCLIFLGNDITLCEGLKGFLILPDVAGELQKTFSPVVFYF